MPQRPVDIAQLVSGEASRLRALNELFAAAFDDSDAYLSAKPGDAYVNAMLSKPHIIVLVAEHEGQMLGGLVAYALQKLEQERSEIYIYDLAVAEGHRRQGIATALIDDLRKRASLHGASVVFVQADQGDDPAIALYTKLGLREDVLHFDITVDHN